MGENVPPPGTAEGGTSPDATAGPETPGGDVPSGRAIGLATLGDGRPCLTDQAGRPLYVLDADRASRPTCFDECEERRRWDTST